MFLIKSKTCNKGGSNKKSTFPDIIPKIFSMLGQLKNKHFWVIPSQSASRKEISSRFFGIIFIMNVGTCPL